jgi:hypothetical protein
MIHPELREAPPARDTVQSQTSAIILTLESLKKNRRN